MKILGHVDSTSRSFVQGWAIDKDGAVEPIAVSILVNGIERGACVANRPRPGLAGATGGAASDTCEFRFEFNPPLSVFEEQRIKVVAALTRQPLAGGERTIPAPPAPLYRPGPRPILVTSTGRSGSTLLMSEFASHPDIVVADRYPFEIKQIAYYAAVFRTLVVDSDRVRSTHPDTMLSSKNRVIGSNPYHAPGFFDLANPRQRLQEFHEAHIPAELATLFQRLVLEFYAILAESQGKPRAPFFCEKGDINPACRQATRLFFGQVKEIAVVRDPRDLLCSAIAFWKLSPDDALAMLKTTLPELEAIAGSPAVDTVVIRYEDLVLDGVKTRRTMSEFLGIDLQRAAKAKPVIGAHRTSSNPAASVGRWKADLTHAQIEVCDAAFGTYMRAFGYAASSTPPKTISHPGPEPADAMFDVEEGEAAVSQVRALSEAGGPGFRLELRFGKDGNGSSMLGRGWSGLEGGYVWTNDNESQVLLPALPAGPAYRLCIFGAPFTHGTALPFQRITVLCDGIEVGTSAVSEPCTLSFDLPAAAGKAGRPVALALRLPDAARPAEVKGGTDSRLLGFSLRRIFIVSASAEPIAAALPPVALPLPMTMGCGAPLPDSEAGVPADLDPVAAAALMRRFESMGENCEFGLVQRKLGADPAGLLSFASAPLPKLLKALHNGFKGMGRAGSLVIEAAPTEYMVYDTQYGFRYHAWVLLGEKTPDVVLHRELEQLPRLIEAFKKDLADAQKIFVYHGMTPLTEPEARKLHEAMRQYGESALLWVELADSANPPGSVTQVAPGLLKGHMDRFAPGENAYNFSVECWARLCQQASLKKARA